MKKLLVIACCMVSLSSFAEVPQVVKDSKGKAFGVLNAALASPDQGRNSVEEAQLDVCMGRELVDSFYQNSDPFMSCYNAAEYIELSPQCPSVSFMRELCGEAYH